MLQLAAVEGQIADDPRDPANAGFELLEDGQATGFASLKGGGGRIMPAGQGGSSVFGQLSVFPVPNSLWQRCDWIREIVGAWRKPCAVPIHQYEARIALDGLKRGVGAGEVRNA